MQPAQPDEEDTPTGPTELDQTQPKEEKKEYRLWVRKPFRVVFDNLSTVKGQYMAIEEALVDISKTLGVPPLAVVHQIKILPKKQEMEDLLARINCLVKENGELKG